MVAEDYRVAFCVIVFGVIIDIVVIYIVVIDTVVVTNQQPHHRNRFCRCCWLMALELVVDATITTTTITISVVTVFV